ncbi:MAG: methyltransferase domain-containing protein [Burkholderiaceae bacterium]
MNLYDLIKRQDRAVVACDKVVSTEEKLSGHWHRTVAFEPGGCVELAQAGDFTVWRDRGPDPYWAVVNSRSPGSALTIEARPHSDAPWQAIGHVATSASGGQPRQTSPAKQSAASRILGAVTRRVFGAESQSTEPKNASEYQAVKFDLEPFDGAAGEFDLRLSASDSGPLLLSTGQLLNPRQRILPLLKGTGIEVGPGSNPFVRPAADVSVRYVEQATADEWAARYKKKHGDNDAMSSLWQNYIVDAAHELSTIEDGSLDFIFSNHVIEHLVNPLAVFEVWHQKLRPGGVIAGAIPDARFTFDVRQPLSSTEDFLRERDAGRFEINDAHYDRWCAYTAPYNTPEDLRARGYSIHIHYYTPEVFEAFTKLLGDRFEPVTIDSVPNNKDFGFSLIKPAA